MFYARYEWCHLISLQVVAYVHSIPRRDGKLSAEGRGGSVIAFSRHRKTVLAPSSCLRFMKPVSTVESNLCSQQTTVRTIHISGLADEGLRLHASPSAAKGVGAAGPSHPVWSRRLLPAFTRLERRRRCARQASLKSRGEMAAP